MQRLHILLLALSLPLAAMLMISSCGSGKWIEDNGDSSQPWLNYRTLDDYIEVVAPGFFSGTAARGVSTVNGNTAPLLMLNDQIVSSYDDVNLQDVQSVEIITDSRVAAYGLRGANGVALVKTKGTPDHKDK